MAGVKGRSGGPRVGAGRPRRDSAGTWLSGHSGKRGPRPVRPVAPVEAPVAKVKRPSHLDAEGLAVWTELAPHALELRTLTPATAMAFGDLCRAIVFERKLALSPLAAAGADHRGMMARVEAGRARFRLTPDGKPVVAVEQPKDEWAEFDGPQLVKQA